MKNEILKNIYAHSSKEPGNWEGFQFEKEFQTG